MFISFAWAEPSNPISRWFDRAWEPLPNITRTSWPDSCLPEFPASIPSGPLTTWRIAPGWWVLLAFKMKSNDVYYGTMLATTAETLVLWHQLRDMKTCKVRALSNECCLDFIGQIIDERSHFSLVRHCLRPSEWRVRRSAGSDSRPIAKWRYPSELPSDAKSKLCTHLIVTQPTK